MIYKVTLFICVISFLTNNFASIQQPCFAKILSSKRIYINKMTISFVSFWCKIEKSIDCDDFANFTIYGILYIRLRIEGLFIHFQLCKEQNQWVVKCLCFGYCSQIPRYKYSERFWQWFRRHQMKPNNKTTIKLMCYFNMSFL